MLTRNLFENSAGEAFSYLMADTHPESKLAVHLAHATGFNAGTYSSLLKDIASFSSVFAMDLRGHGHSTAATDTKNYESWDVYASDLIEFINSTNREFVLVGHSMGAVVSLLASLVVPDRVKSLLLIEPVFSSPPMCALLALVKKLRLNNQLPLAKGAAKRRNHFTSVSEIQKRYQSKTLFSSWQEPWLENYVESGFTKNSEGAYSLRCNPEWESWSFSVPPHNHWACIQRVSVPVTLCYGGKLSTFSALSAKTFKKILPGTHALYLEQASHFLPMEYPTVVLEHIKQTVGD